MTYTGPSSDADRELELQLRNSVALATFTNNFYRSAPRPSLMDRHMKQATWLRDLGVKVWRNKWARRHPNNPLPPQAA